MNKKMIILPSGKSALAIEIKSLDDMNLDFFKSIDLSSTERFVCIHMQFEGKRIFVMAVKHELQKGLVLPDLAADLAFQMTNIAVLRQL